MILRYRAVGPHRPILSACSLSVHRSYERRARGAAHTLRKSILEYFFASSSTAAFMALHGSAHGAQKLVTDTRSRLAESTCWKCSGELIVTKFEDMETRSGCKRDEGEEKVKGGEAGDYQIAQPIQSHRVASVSEEKSRGDGKDIGINISEVNIIVWDHSSIWSHDSTIIIGAPVLLHHAHAASPTPNPTSSPARVGL